MGGYATGALAQNTGTTPKSTDLPTSSYAVELDGVAVLEVRSGFKTLSAEERARGIAERLLRVARDPSIPAEHIGVRDTDISADIVADDRVVMSVFDSDAAEAGVGRAQLAGEVADRMRKSVVRYREERGGRSLLIAAGLSAITLAAAVALILLVGLAYRRTRAAVRQRGAVKLATLEARSRRLLRMEGMLRFLLGVLRFIRLVLWVAIAYTALNLTLSYFPHTRALSAKLSGYVLDPVLATLANLLESLPGVIFIVVVIFATRYILRLMHFFFLQVERGRITIEGFFPEWAKPTTRIASILIIAFAAMIAYPYIPGSESPAFKGVSIFVGVLFSLGSTGAVANMVNGVILTYMRAFKVGNVVKIGDAMGVVTESSLLVTRVRTNRNIEIIVPNSAVMSGQITNYSAAGLHMLVTRVSVGYDAPWRQVYALLIGAARATAGVESDPEPFVLQKALDDFYVCYELNCSIRDPYNVPVTLSTLHENIQDAFNRNGVQIMSPHYVLQPRHAPMVPPERWHTAPA